MSIEDSSGASHEAGGSGSSNSQDNLVLSELRSLKSTFTSSLEAISFRVDKLSETVYGGSSAHAQTPAESGSHSWDEICKSPRTRPQPMWGASDDEEEEPCPGRVVELDDNDRQFVQGTFTKGVSNAERRHLRSCYPSTDLPHTRCPRLDPVFKTSLAKSADVKAVDKELARAQALVLDSVGPLTHLISKVGNEGYTVEEAEETARDALRLVANASMNIAKMRRKRVLKCLNPKMQDMAEEHDLFQSAAPMLFGQGFESKMKERSESLKILSSCSRSRDSSPPPRKKQSFFRQGHSSAPQRGSGDSKRGRPWSKSKPAPARK